MDNTHVWTNIEMVFSDLKITSILFLFGINADLNRIKSGVYREYMRQMNSSVVTDNEDVARPASELTRGLGSIATVINMLDGYGCWCYFSGEMVGKGHGEPQDVLDEECQTLVNGYACARIDSNDRRCVPWDIDYREVIGQPNREKVCHEVNPANSCAAFACIAESNFVVNIVRAFFSSGRISQEIRHSNGFDVTAECNARTGGDDRYEERNCCGVWPDRFPFQTRKGSRACCGSKTYDTTIYECCSDLTVAFSCSK